MNKPYIESAFEEENQKAPEISVIVPIYNSEKYLLQCLESIKSQTFSNFECILINDGSTDSSEDICREFCNKDQRFVLFCQENLGVSAARNNGLSHCRGKYIAFLDSDDFVEPTYLCELHKGIQGANLSVVRTIYEYDNDEKFKKKTVIESNPEQQMVETEDWVEISLWKSMDLFVWCKLFCSEILRSNEITFDTSISFGEDALFLARYCTAIKSDHVCVSNANVHHYRVGGGASFGHYSSKVLTAFIAFDMMEEIFKNSFPKCVASLRTYRCFLYMFYIYRMKKCDFSAADIKKMQKMLRESLRFILHDAKYYPFFLKLCSICMAYCIPIGCALFSPVFSSMMTGSDNHG